VNINATLIFQAIAFFIFVAFCMKFIWPPVIRALEERQKKIAEGLDAANRAERDLDLAKEKISGQLREAKEQAADIIEQAKKRSAQMVEEAREQAKVEAERVKQQARAEIEQEVTAIKEALRAQLGLLAVSGAEKILGAAVDAKAHDKLLNQLAAQI